VVSTTPDEIRELARKRLEDRRGFFQHILVYVLVNAALIILWASAAGRGTFWPGFVLGFWGIGLVMHAWDVFFKRPITPADVEREVQRMSRGSRSSPGS
jgi:2TM domain